MEAVKRKTHKSRIRILRILKTVETDQFFTHSEMPQNFKNEIRCDEL